MSATPTTPNESREAGWIPASECPLCQQWSAKFGPCGFHERYPTADSYAEFARPAPSDPSGEWVRVPREDFEQFADALDSLRAGAEERNDKYDVAYIGKMVEHADAWIAASPSPPVSAPVAPTAEPVAWMHVNDNDQAVFVRLKGDAERLGAMYDKAFVPLYAHAPPAEVVTEEVREAIERMDDHCGEQRRGQFLADVDAWNTIARFLPAALSARNVENPNGEPK